MLLLAIWKDRNVDEWNQVWRKEEIKNVWHPNLRWKFNHWAAGSLSALYARNNMVEIDLDSSSCWWHAIVDSKVAGSDRGDCAASVQSWSFWGPRRQVRADDRYRRTPQDLQFSGAPSDRSSYKHSKHTRNVHLLCSHLAQKMKGTRSL